MVSVDLWGVFFGPYPRGQSERVFACDDDDERAGSGAKAKFDGHSSCRRPGTKKRQRHKIKIITARWRDREEPAPSPPLRVEDPATNRNCQRIPTPSLPHLSGRSATHMLPRSTRLQKTDLRYPPLLLLLCNRHQIVALISKAATHYPVPNPR